MNRKNKWIEKLKHKEIVIWGAGHFARKFYSDYEEEINFSLCITNNPEEKYLVVDDKEVLEVCEKGILKERHNIFIIICVEQSKDIQEQLRIMGYRYGEDFIDSTTLRMLLSKKRIAIFYGVCYIRAIYSCLQESGEFVREYDSLYWLDYERRDPCSESLLGTVLNDCDLFVCNSYLSKVEEGKKAILTDELKPECEVITIPILIFYGYYPCHRSEIGKDNKYCLYFAESPFATFQTPDRKINRLFEEGKSRKEILKIVSDEDLFSKEYLKENYEKEMRKLEIAESLSTIKICDYLYEMNGKIRTFINEKHISNAVVREISIRILKYLSLGEDVPESVCEKRLLFTSEVPLYPSVIKALDLQIYQGKVKLFTFAGDRMVTFEEYVEEYYDYCRIVTTLVNKGFTPKQF